MICSPVYTRKDHKVLRKTFPLVIEYLKRWLSNFLGQHCMTFVCTASSCSALALGLVLLTGLYSRPRHGGERSQLLGFSRLGACGECLLCLELAGSHQAAVRLPRGVGPVLGDLLAGPSRLVSQVDAPFAFEHPPFLCLLGFRSPP